MELKWTDQGLRDLSRLYVSLSTVQQLTTAPTNLLANPRIGERLEEFEPRDVRRLLVGNYEMRYEMVNSTLYLLRVWHTREHR